MLRQQAFERLMQIIERRPPPCMAAHFVPRFVRQALHVVGQIARELHDRVAQTRFRLDSCFADNLTNLENEVRLGELSRGDVDGN